MKLTLVTQFGTEGESGDARSRWWLWLTKGEWQTIIWPDKAYIWAAAVGELEKGLCGLQHKARHPLQWQICGCVHRYLIPDGPTNPQAKPHPQINTLENLTPRLF